MRRLLLHRQGVLTRLASRGDSVACPAPIEAKPVGRRVGGGSRHHGYGRYDPLQSGVSVRPQLAAQKPTEVSIVDGGLLEVFGQPLEEVPPWRSDR